MARFGGWWREKLQVFLGGKLKGNGLGPNPRGVVVVV